MTNEAIEVGQAHPAAFHDFVNEGLRRSGLGFLRHRLHHLRCKLRGYIAADMYAQLLLFLDEEQARIGPLFHIEALLLGFFFAREPIPAAHEEILEHHFLLGLDVII